jgi:RNA polymerase sigma-70 factor (ECF subfamily)
MSSDADYAVVDALFQEWASPLLRYAYGLTRSQSAAEDLVQEAFLLLYCELRKGTEIRNARGWLLGVVSKKAARLRRDAKRWSHDQIALETATAPNSQPDTFESEPTRDDVLASLGVLTVRESEVLLLRLQSLKYREIAEQLGISAKSVATLLARAVTKVRSLRGSTSTKARIWVDANASL